MSRAAVEQTFDRSISLAVSNDRRYRLSKAEGRERRHRGLLFMSGFASAHCGVELSLRYSAQ